MVTQETQREELGKFVGSAIDNFCRFVDRKDMQTYGPGLESALRKYVVSIQANMLTDAKRHRDDVIGLIDTVIARYRRRAI